MYVYIQLPKNMTRRKYPAACARAQTAQWHCRWLLARGDVPPDARRTGGDAANQEGLSCGSLAAHDQDPSGAAWEGQWKEGAQHGENQAARRRGRGGGGRRGRGGGRCDGCICILLSDRGSCVIVIAVPIPVGPSASTVGPSARRVLRRHLASYYARVRV